MELRFEGITDNVLKVKGKFEELKDEVSKKYQAGLQAIVEKIESDAVTNLNKPTWLLSDYIHSKTKLYKDNKLIFGVAEVVGKQNWSTPDYKSPSIYGWFQERGYFIEPGRVKRGRAKNWKYSGKGSNKAKKSYKKQTPKMFMKRAITSNKPFIEETINTIHRAILKELEGSNE